MNGVTKVGLAGLVFFATSWAFIFAHSALLGQIRIEHFGSLVISAVVLLFIFWKYRNLIHTKPSHMEEFLEIHVIYGWHAVILPLLAFFVSAMTVGVFQPGFVDKLVTGELGRLLVVYFFFVYTLLLGIAVVATSKIIVYDEGFWTIRGFFGWDDFRSTKMRLRGRLLIFNKGIFILLNPSKFMRAIRKFQTNSALAYIKTRKKQ